MLVALLVYKVVLEVKAELGKTRPVVSPGLCHGHDPLFFVGMPAPEAAA